MSLNREPFWEGFGAGFNLGWMLMLLGAVIYAAAVIPTSYERNLEAVKHHVGRFVTNPDTGSTKFKWNDEP